MTIRLKTVEGSSGSKMGFEAPLLHSSRKRCVGHCSRKKSPPALLWRCCASAHSSGSCHLYRCHRPSRAACPANERTNERIVVSVAPIISSKQRTRDQSQSRPAICSNQNHTHGRVRGSSAAARDVLQHSIGCSSAITSICTQFKVLPLLLRPGWQPEQGTGRRAGMRRLLAGHALALVVLVRGGGAAGSAGWSRGR